MENVLQYSWLSEDYLELQIKEVISKEPSYVWLCVRDLLGKLISAGHCRSEEALNDWAPFWTSMVP